MIGSGRRFGGSQSVRSGWSCSTYSGCGKGVDLELLGYPECVRHTHVCTIAILFWDFKSEEVLVTVSFGLQHYRAAMAGIETRK